MAGGEVSLSDGLRDHRLRERRRREAKDRGRVVVVLVGGGGGVRGGGWWGQFSLSDGERNIRRRKNLRRLLPLCVGGGWKELVLLFS